MSTVLTFGGVILLAAALGMLTFSRLRLRTIGLVLAGVGVAIAAAAVWFGHALERALERQGGRRHFFSITEPTPFLEETVALEMAGRTLALDGLTNATWSPVADGRTAAPDGRIDAYLLRNAEEPRRGLLSFTNSQGARTTFAVEINGTNVVCQRMARK